VLARAGYQVMRFSNLAVRTDIDNVMDAIVMALEARASVKGSPSPENRA
jgi:very-short-patch-repair endonuclease